jgi:hypothetical protein
MSLAWMDASFSTDGRAAKEKQRIEGKVKEGSEAVTRVSVRSSARSPKRSKAGVGLFPKIEPIVIP